MGTHFALSHFAGSVGLKHYQILAAPLDDCLTQPFAEIPEASPELLAHLCYT